MPVQIVLSPFEGKKRKGKGKKISTNSSRQTVKKALSNAVQVSIRRFVSSFEKEEERRREKKKTTRRDPPGKRLSREASLVLTDAKDIYVLYFVCPPSRCFPLPFHSSPSPLPVIPPFDPLISSPSSRVPLFPLPRRPHKSYSWQRTPAHHRFDDGRKNKEDR